MKEFQAAEAEIILFEEDVVVASCTKVTCPGNSCVCDGNYQCVPNGQG